MSGNNCRHCRASIEWATNESNGRRIPLDSGSTVDGNIVRTGAVNHDGSPFVTVYANPMVAKASAGLEVRLFTNHLAHCNGRRRR